METPGSGNNICNVYMLPLISLNKHSFGEGKLINSYISEDNDHIVVESHSPFTTVITNNGNFRFAMERDGKHIAVFQVPEFYKEEVVKFRKGQYSKFKEQAKALIKKKSGLLYRAIGTGGKYNTALELLALDKAPELKKYWEEKLSNKGSKVVIDDDAELASIPDENNFYTLNLSSQLTQI